MSSRPLLAPYSVITNASMAADVIGKVSIIQMLKNVSYTVTWSGAPTGSINVEVSDDYSLNPDGSVKNAGTWTLVPGMAAAAVGVPDSAYFDISINSYAIRVHYVRTGGAGTLNAIVCAKAS